ncbi:SAM-dependent methyltransferase [Amycolatopsis rhabdoformis]|uniref:SAM-dependent methyltransferase n=1 Tax=Amycolatopsis rhabdoformis TaxID=1448059 RepID=A0ABZ1I132_9PSEU|nr:SAM-dependent methyltransferase [Amycolatopsis rhabdoformis]WSE28096.1 SAM-dependent methyltransferase [Amycolatopsis rhabdoformis]
MADPLAPVDFDRPSNARVYDALMGGRDHYAADRAVLNQILELAPGAQTMAQEVRHWLVRAVRMLTGRLGIDQFLDLGSGFPTVENTHQVVQRVKPEAHVVYVDHDPVVQAHGRALLAENDYTHMAGADLLDPERTLAHPEVTAHLDLTRPLGLILCAVVHHIPDFAVAQAVVKAYVDALAPGSFLVLLHQYNPADGSEAASVASALEARFAATGLDTVYRTREEITSLFGGLELLPPGVTHPHLWWPDGPRLAPLSAVNFATLAGVARVP